MTFCRSSPRLNSIVVVEAPCTTEERMVLTLEMLATASSIGRVTWVSISPGAAPLWVTVTVTAGNSTLGNCLIGRPR